METLQSVESKLNFLNQIRKLKLSDIELTAIDLTSEFLGINPKRNLFGKLPVDLSSKIERSVYNRRKSDSFIIESCCERNWLVVLVFMTIILLIAWHWRSAN